MTGIFKDIMIKSTNERDYSLDLIKFISILMVVVLHVSSNGFTSSESRLWNGANFFESFTRTCVPLFFMVTGALLGYRSCAFKDSISRVKRIFIPLLFWSAAYTIFFHQLNDSEISFTSFISKPAAGHLWYLYTLIGVYITLPIINVLLTKTNQRQQTYIILVWLASCVIIPSLKSYNLLISPFFDLSSIGLYQGYFFCGAFLASIRKGKAERVIASATFIFMSIMIMLLTKQLFENEGLHDVRNYLNSSIFVCLASLTAFYALHGIKINSNRIKFFLGFQSKYTFGVYLIHLFFIYLLGSVGLSLSSGNVYYFTPIIATCIYAVSILACKLLYSIKLNIFIS